MPATPATVAAAAGARIRRGCVSVLYLLPGDSLAEQEIGDLLLQFPKR